MSEALIGVIVGGLIAFIPQAISLRVQYVQKREERKLEYLNARKAKYLEDLGLIERLLSDFEGQDKTLSVAKIKTTEFLIATKPDIYSEMLGEYAVKLHEYLKDNSGRNLVAVRDASIQVIDALASVIRDIDRQIEQIIGIN